LILLVVLSGCAKPAPEPPKGKVSAEVADQGPRLVGNPPTVQIELPPRMTQALARGDTAYATLSPFDFVPEIVPGDTASGVWRYPYDGRQAPFAVIGDFDGDERDDVAILQRLTEPSLMHPSMEGGRVVFVFDRMTGAVAVTATSWNFPAAGKGGKSAFYMTRYPAGRHSLPDFGGSGADTRTITLPFESVEIANWGKTARVLAWTGEGFEAIQTAD
jgi:hypothetical protein